MMGAGSLERAVKLHPGCLPAALLICLLNKQSQPGTLTQPFGGIKSSCSQDTLASIWVCLGLRGDVCSAWQVRTVKTCSSDLPVTTKDLTMSVRLTSEQNTLVSFPERLCLVHNWDEVRAHTHTHTAGLDLTDLNTTNRSASSLLPRSSPMVNSALAQPSHCDTRRAGATHAFTQGRKPHEDRKLF